jgi:hypothetical protein
MIVTSWVRFLEISEFAPRSVVVVVLKIREAILKGSGHFFDLLRVGQLA